jgi:hypothetical protein
MNLLEVSREAGRWSDRNFDYESGKDVDDEYEDTFSKEVADYAPDRHYLQIARAVIEALAQEAARRFRHGTWDVVDKEMVELDDWLRAHMEDKP